MRAWYNPYDFPITQVLERNFAQIQHEALLTYAMGLYTEHVQSAKSPVASIMKLAGEWKQFSITVADKVNPIAEKYAPFTTQLLSTSAEVTGCAHGLTYFSWIPAGAVVLPHVAVDMVRIRSQLCLVKPDVRPEDEVFIRVGGEKRGWELGKVMTFNDLVMHDVLNRSRHSRLVLLYDQIKPDWAVKADEAAASAAT